VSFLSWKHRQRPASCRPIM